MLTGAEIKAFRSCRDVSLKDLGPMTVLVGRNAVGKSNILRSLEWVAKTATSIEPVRPWGDNEEAVSVTASYGSGAFRYALETKRDWLRRTDGMPDLHIIERLKHQEERLPERVLLDRKLAEVSLSCEPWRVSIGTSVACMPALLSILPADHPSLDLIRTLYSILHGVRYYPLENDETSDTTIVTQRAYAEWLDQYRATGNPGESTVFRVLHMYLNGDPRLRELESLLGSDGLGLIDRIRIEPLDRPQSREEPNSAVELYSVFFQPVSHRPKLRGVFSLDELSSGTRRVVRILLALIFDKPTVMLLEHPEEGIHRGLLRKLIDVLKAYSDQTQLILTSHSSVVFNTLDPGAVRLVTMQKGITQIRPLSLAETRAAARFLEDEGTLADFLEGVEED